MAFTLERYVFRQAAQAFLVGLFALTSIIFIGMAASLMQRGYNIIQVRTMWGYLLLYSLPYAVPVALLCAVVMTFGRMSGDNEILAARSSGVWPDRLGFPAVLLGVLLTGASLWLYQWALPAAHLRVDQFKDTMFKMVISNLGVSGNPYEIKPYQIYVHSVDPNTGEWLHVVIFHVEGNLVRRVMRAERGRCIVSEEEELARLSLKRCLVMEPAASAKGIESLDKWTKSDGSSPAMDDLPGGVTSGPMDMAIDIDLSSKRRRSLDKADLKVLPLLLKELETRGAEVANLPKVKRPLTERHAREKARDRAYRAFQRVQREVAHQQAEAARIEEELRALLAQSDSALSRRRRIERDLGRLEERLGHLARERDELTRELEGRAGEEARLKERLEAIAKTREGVREQAEAARRELKDAMTRAGELNKQIETRRKELAGVLAPLEGLEDEAARLQEEYQAREAEYREAKAWQDYNEARMEFHSRNASAASCLVFVLIGIPLGIIAHRGNLIYALAFSFGVILLIYYPLTMVAHMLASDLFVAPMLAFWAPVAIVGVIGVLLQVFALRR